MEVKVLKTFRDKYTKAINPPGQIIDVSEERLAEINSTALGVLAEAVSKVPKKGAKSKKGA